MAFSRICPSICSGVLLHGVVKLNSQSSSCKLSRAAQHLSHCLLQPRSNLLPGQIARGTSSKRSNFGSRVSTRMVSPIDYPTARRDESVVDNYHGHEVSDPYRWLEDPDSDETKAFVAAQNEVTQALLAKCETRGKLKERLTALFDYPNYGCPFKYGRFIFYFFNKGLQPQFVLYKQSSLDAEPEVLLDPNELSDDGTVALKDYSLSHDGELLAYGLSSGGSDWETVHVMRVESGEKLPDVLKWVKFTSFAWTHDGLGFFYNRYDEPSGVKESSAGTETNSNRNQKVYYHFLGTDQSEDILCWQNPENPEWMFGAEVSDDGEYLLLSISSGCDPVNRLFYLHLPSLPPSGLKSFQDSHDLLPFVKLIDNFDAEYSYVANDGASFTFRTNKSAPRYRVVRMDLSRPEDLEDVVAESERDVLEWARCVAEDKLVVCHMRDVKNALEVRRLSDGSLLSPLPLSIGTVASSSGRRCESELFFSFTGLLNPKTIFRCDLSGPGEALELKVFRDTEIAGFDRTLFESTQVFVPSKDGTKIPMFIVHRKGLSLDSSHPALLYGYGGFNISLTPSFSAARVVLMQHFNAVTAVANIRGGGEYGETWHKAGSLERKQNCFDDFVSCAEYLVAKGYTNQSKLCIEGGSNGGLLVAACANQRPDLFGCVLAHVGVMDMLRFHRFTIGHAWTTDYGCADKAEEFQWLIRYSPIHNVKRPWEVDSTSSLSSEENGVPQYPAMMLLTGDHDDRVVPLHSVKLAATLQHTLTSSLDGPSPQSNPILLRVDVKSGHGAGTPTQKRIDEYSDIYSFMAKCVGAEWND